MVMLLPNLINIINDMMLKLSKKQLWLLTIFVVITLLLSTLFYFPPKPSQHINKLLTLPEKKISKIVHPPIKHSLSIQPGDTLSTIFEQENLGYSLAQRLSQLHIASPYLNNLKPNNTLTITTDHHNQLTQLDYTISKIKTLTITHNEQGFSAAIHAKNTSTKPTLKEGVIHSSFAQTATSLGIPNSIQLKFIDIFQGTIDFKRSIHKGDSFTILYNEHYINGKKDQAKNILLATLTHNKKTYTAIAYTHNNHTHYYAKNGQSLEPLFKLPPLKYKRISSGYSLRRLNPITHKIQPHLGIDYAAPIGTPIHSIGNGTIVFQGWSKGYGRTITIQYDKQYRGLYAHMSRYAKHSTKHVRKGETIGYVGQTGRATGPHLHFSLFHQGRAINPLTLKMPNLRPLQGKQLAEFQRSTITLFNTISSLEQPSPLTQQRDIT